MAFRDLARKCLMVGVLCVGAVALGNTAPGAPVVSLPVKPSADSDLTVSIDTESTDTDGDAISYSYAWTKNSSPTTDTTATISASSLTAGDTWAVVVTPNDGTDDGATASASTTLNSLPGAPAVSLPSKPSADSELTVSIDTESTDTDSGDAISYSYAWTKNSSPTTDPTATISASSLTAGDTWAVVVTPSDGTDDGATASASTQINTPPTATVSISTSKVEEGDSIECAATSADLDGDSVTFSFVWTVDGNARSASSSTVDTSTYTIVAPDPGLDSSFDNIGDEIVCTVTPSDGTDSGTPLTDTATVCETWYLDQDSDGFGTDVETDTTTAWYCGGAEPTEAKDGSSGTFVSADIDGDGTPDIDCDDIDPAINPGATEVCEPDTTSPDEVDNDCDPTNDPTRYTVFADDDGDGYGSDEPSYFCNVPTGYETSSGDCDDDDVEVNPGAEEVCDSIDNDCDGDVDDDDVSLVAGTFWADRDGDGFGDSGVVFTGACTPPSGYIALPDDTDIVDCNDLDASINPDATEICDSIDNDCDDLIDDEDVEASDNATGFLDTSTGDSFYPDVDSDSYPDITGEVKQQCSKPSGYILLGTGGGDCNDAVATINPGATEICDGGLDNDCDGLADEADDSLSPVATFYTDADNDTFGDLTAPYLSCESTPPAGYVTDSSDCDDSTEEVRPGFAEVCDGRLNNCSTGGGVPSDEIDGDGDGFVECGYDGTITWHGASAPSIGEDCGPFDPNTFPYATEVCDGIFNDCASSAYSATLAPSSETDDDSDGYVECFDGSEPWVGLAAEPGVGEDCDDANSTVYPNATELCDGIYNDCLDLTYGTADAPVDETDDDEDGHVECWDGSTTWVGSASPVVGQDCDDSNAAISPSAVEVGLCDGVDTDCDTLLWADETDVDGDGFVTCGFVAADWLGSAAVTGGEDCDDSEATGAEAYAGAIELCDGRFNDCDDPFYDVMDAPEDETDDDGDSFVECYDGLFDWLGDASVQVGEDCDDDDPYAYPGASPSDVDPEACTRDADEDGWGDASATDPVTPGSDCDDGAINTYPGAPEECDGDGDQQDNDCDGNPNTQGGEPVGEGDASFGSVAVYWDGDGDGWGDVSSPVYYVCTADALEGVYSYANTDCNDANPTIYPGAPEICNGVDDNCNDQVDRVAELDPDASGCTAMFRDLDGDGYGDPDEPACVCADRSDPDGAYDGDERYVLYEQDCDDSNANTKPPSCADGIDNDGDDLADSDDPDCKVGLDERGIEAERNFIFMDGSDNDCDGRVAAVELDCDDDGSFAMVPRQASAFLNASEIGLASCGDAGTTRSLACWGVSDLQVECDEESQLWMFRYADAAEAILGDRYDGGRRQWTGDRACFTPGDCDDQCALRCPGQDESCDGIDNDCSGASLATEATETAVPGIPASLLARVGVSGTVSDAEQDIDDDGYLACDTFSRRSTQLFATDASCSDVVEDEALLTDCEQRCTLTFPGAEERCNGFLDACEGESEGSDRDFDGHRTCGAWSNGGQDEMPEDVVVLVWIAPEDEEAGDLAADTAAGDSGSVEEAISWSGEWGYVPLILPRALELSSSLDRPTHQDLWQTRLADGDRRWSCDDPVDEDLDRRVLYSCDRDLFDALAQLVGNETLEEAICAQDATELLSACGRAGGECGLVTVTLDANVDASLWSEDVPNYLDSTFDELCISRPEELISRGVWPASRILAARKAVVAFECERLYGRTCTEIGSSTPLVEGWKYLPDATDALVAESAWWKELGRFETTALSVGTVGWCWGDPTGGVAKIGQRTGGDCSDDSLVSHRDAAEGPGDLIGYLTANGAADCSTCVDGLDNNCDGQIDCADPSCAACYVGQGAGCGGGDQAECVGSGCSTVGGRLPRSTSRGWVMLMAGLLGLLGARRKRA